MNKFARSAGSVFAAAMIALCIAPAAGAATAPAADVSPQLSANAFAPTDHGHGPGHRGGSWYGYGYGYGPSSSSYGSEDPWSDADAGNYGECYQDHRPAWCDSDS
jgi:hypothetical protein